MVIISEEHNLTIISLLILASLMCIVLGTAYSPWFLIGSVLATLALGRVALEFMKNYFSLSRLRESDRRIGEQSA